jgi:nucleotide-binding universal stress UspA family protein
VGYLMLVLSPTRDNPKSVDLALSLVKKTGRPLLAVFIADLRLTEGISGRVVDIGFLGDSVSTHLEEAVLKDYEARGRKELEAVKSKARALGVKCETVVRRGYYVEEILKIAEEREIEDIIVSRAERSNLARKLLGSAVNDLLEQSPCPVMVVDDSSVESHEH